MKHLKLISLLFLCVLGSCIISKQKNIPTSEQKSLEKSESTAKLIFINFIIIKDSAQDNSTVNITQVKITEGRIKKKNLPDIYQPVYQNELRCVIVDKNEKNIYKTILEHPLFKRYEYSMEDGSISAKNIVLKKAVFFIRTDYNPDMKYVHVFEKLSPSEEKEIAKLELKK